MMNWALVAGGHSAKQPWCVQVAGYCLLDQQAFLLSDAQWAALEQELPLQPLLAYGQSDAMTCVRALDMTGPCDGVLLIAHQTENQPALTLPAETQRYLLLRQEQQLRQVDDENAFSRIFVPSKEQAQQHPRVYIDSLKVPETDPAGGQTWPIERDAQDRDYARNYHCSADYWLFKITTSIAEAAAQAIEAQPLLSVIVPTYNYGRYLAQCIQSVLEQCIDDIEILVLDNASTDETPQVMAAFSDHPNVRYIRNRYNYGPGYNWRNGLRIAQGRYFTFLSADDYFNPGHLSRLLNALETHPQSAVGYTGIRWVDEAGHALNQPRHPGYRHGDYVGERNEVADLLIHDSYMTPSAVIFRREAFLQTWNPGNTYGAGDWEMVVQMAERYPDFIYMDNPGVSYRWHGSQYSTQFYASTEPLLGHLAIVEGVFERNAQHHLRGREREVAAHLRRRLELYPAEHDTALGARARKLCEHLEQQARQQERALFSIILTTYNRPQLLRDALNSIAEQSLRDFDVILVNDNGDPVESLLADYDFPITYLRQGRNRGPAAARNAALRLARGHHVVFLDDDDLYLPDHLAHLAKGLEANPGCVVYTDAVFIQEQITAGQRQELAREQRYPHEQYAREQLLINNYIPINTFACPRDLALAVGEFDETLAGLEDWDFLLRLCARSVFHHVPRETVQVRMRVDSQAPARRSEQAFKDYPSLYRELYARHSDGGSEQVKRGRQEMLDFLSGKPSPSTLQTWLAERVPGPLQRRLIEQRLDEHGGGPMIGVVVVDAEGQAEAVNTTLQSLSSRHCLYAKVKVIVLTAADLSSMPVHSGVQLARLSEESLGVQLNLLVEAGEFDWFMRVDAGSEFTPSGLLIAALDLLAAPECRAVYADEGLRGDGAEMGAALRPDLNLDLLLSLPASMARHWLFNRQVWLDMGGFEQQAGKAFELAYILRLIEGQGFAGLGHISEPLLIGEAPSLYDCPDQRGVIVRHLQARGFAQARVESPLPGRYALEYGAPGDIPVSIMIVVQGTGAERAQRCVESILEKTTHRNYEVLLVAPVKADAAVDGWLNAVAQLGADAIRCLRLATGLSPAQMRNQAASQARGNFLLWLDEGTAVLDGDWLQQLLNHGMRQEVGVVGAKLVAGDATIRHAGYVLGLNGPVGEAFAGMPLDAPGYLQRLQVDQNYSAVSGKCLLVNKGLFLEVGGFDETPALQRWLDVDLCLRLRSAGYLSVWTPRAQLLLSEDVASAPSVEQEDALYARWLPALATDPFHNPNFSLSSTNGFALAPNALSWRPLASWKPLPMILAHAADRFGCGHYRVIQPLEALTRDGLAEGVLSWNHLSPAELERCRPDSIVLQRQVGDEQIEHMRRMHAFSQAFKVFELDDYLPNLPLKSVHRAHMPKDILRSLRRGLAYVDRFVVSTEPLAEAFAGLHGDVRVVPNTLEPHIWSGLVALRRQSRKPRVGWAGGAGHTGDLEVIADVVKALANEVEWVFFGLCPAKLRPYIHEYYEHVPIDRYPATLARMNLDLALAPVEQNLFNACKSNLRLLEYGACGFPVIASDVRCYQGFDDLPVTLVKNRFRAWVDAIRMHIADLDATAKAGDELRKAVLDGWMLEGDRLADWRKAWLAD